MSLKDKSNSSIQLAYSLEKDGELNLAANRFYYSIFQKTLHYAEQHGYRYEELSDEKRKGSHKSLIDYINQVVSDERKKNPGNLKINNISSIQRDFNIIKNLRVKADYQHEDITPDDIENIKKTLNDFNTKYSLLKQI